MKRPRVRSLSLLLFLPLATAASAREPVDDGAQSASRRSRQPGTEVVAQRGDVRIVLAGSCGPGGEGREAVLQHRDGYANVSVVVETSTWSHQRFRTSRRGRHTLTGHEERKLGCTRLTSGVELRFALAQSSDNSVAHDPDFRHDHRAPPRQFIALVDAGTCGRRGEGRRIAAVNRNPHRSILVHVARVERLDGAFRKRSKKSYRLAPGGEKELGCSRQGKLELELSVAEARW